MTETEGLDAAPAARPAPSPRPMWRSVVVPAEHGGWGLTFEAALLGLLVRPSLAGLAIGVVALLAFVARTPLKLALVDRRRHRRLPRSVLAQRVAAVELTALAALLVTVALTAHAWWWAPLAGALPFFALELTFDVRSRGRRLLPEVSGAVGMGAVAAAIALAGGAGARVAIGLWVVLAARAVASVPYAHSQVRRLKRQADRRRLADVAQLLAGVVAVGGWVLGSVPWEGAAAIGALAAWELGALRAPVRSAKQVGMLQLAAGLIVVAAVVIGVRVG